MDWERLLIEVDRGSEKALLELTKVLERKGFNGVLRGALETFKDNSRWANGILYWAAERNYVETTQTLLGEASGYIAESLLNHALYNDSWEVARVIIEDTPAWFLRQIARREAIKKNNIEFFKEFRFTEEDGYTQYRNDGELFALAVTYGRIEIMRLFLEKGFDSKTVPSILNIAVKANKKDALQILLEAGCTFESSPTKPTMSLGENPEPIRVEMREMLLAYDLIEP